MADEVARTRTEFVHRALRSDVLRGRYVPGQRLRVVELVQKFSVSQSVVREALTRLAEQKLVVALPQQGFRVMSLRADDLKELTEARVELESLVIRMAVMRGDLAWETSVVAAHHQLARTTAEVEPDGTLSEQWFTAHEEFHAALLAGSGNAWLTDLAATLRAASGMYRRWSASIARDYERDIPAEHRSLLQAVLDRDPDAAADVVANHIRRTTEAFKEILANDRAQDAG